MERSTSVNLFIRFLSTLVMVPLVIGAVWWDGWIFESLVIAILMIAAWEWTRLAQKVHTGFALLSSAISWILVVMVPFIAIALVLKGWLCAFVVGAFFAGTILFYNLHFLKKQNLTNLRSFPYWMLIGVPYIGIATASILWLREYSAEGRSLVLFVLLAIWATDTGAYVFGKSIGGPKLAPKISPKKTWAGFIGGEICAAVIGAFIGPALDISSWYTGLFLGLILALAGQLGDLFKSILKRQADVKDSGHLIPGHGGVLDRIDSLMFAAPAMTVVLFFSKVHKIF